MVLEVRSDSDEMLDGFPEDPPAALDAKLAALRCCYQALLALDGVKEKA